MLYALSCLASSSLSLLSPPQRRPTVVLYQLIPPGPLSAKRERVQVPPPPRFLRTSFPHLLLTGQASWRVRLKVWGCSDAHLLYLNSFGPPLLEHHIPCSILHSVSLP
ncbi:hypothetical protein BD414DRAFT_249401 [Trametes punicea]|nr:hypothetical protein BD414DRAFT_249401 [Trametes punicea]